VIVSPSSPRFVSLITHAWRSHLRHSFVREQWPKVCNLSKPFTNFSRQQLLMALLWRGRQPPECLPFLTLCDNLESRAVLGDAKLLRGCAWLITAAVSSGMASLVPAIISLFLKRPHPRLPRTNVFRPCFHFSYLQRPFKPNDFSSLDPLF